MIIIYSLISVVFFAILFSVFFVVRKQKRLNKPLPLPVNPVNVSPIKYNRAEETKEQHPQRPDWKGKERRYYGDKVLDDKEARNMEKKALKAYLHGDFYFFWKGKRYRTPEIFI